MLAPRHLERVDEVADRVTAHGLPCVRRSDSRAPWQDEPPVLLLDTLGELAGLYARATVAFVGGTLAPIGGHNLLEPAQAGCRSSSDRISTTCATQRPASRLGRRHPRHGRGPARAGVDALLDDPHERERRGPRAATAAGGGGLAAQRRSRRSTAICRRRTVKRDVPFRERVWKRQGLLPGLVHYGLRPLSAVYATAARTKSLLYFLRLRRGALTGAAVVSVGNLSVGGTGKTPTALWLAQCLAATWTQVSRSSREATAGGGSARRSSGPRPRRTSPQARIGTRSATKPDAPRRFGGPVVVARRRADAVRLAVRAFDIDVAVVDDGFQHLPLARQFDLVLLRSDEVDASVTLPAGRLREPRSALRRADAVLVRRAGSHRARKQRSRAAFELAPSTTARSA